MNSDYMGGHLAGLKPKIRPSRRRDVIPGDPDKTRVWKGATVSFEEKDARERYLLSLYGPQPEYIHPKLRRR